MTDPLGCLALGIVGPWRLFLACWRFGFLHWLRDGGDRE